MKDIDSLIQMIPKLEVMDFIGVARILRVDLVKTDEEGKVVARDFTEVLDDTLRAFKATGRQKRRDIMRIVKQAYADNTKNSKANRN